MPTLHVINRCIADDSQERRLLIVFVSEYLQLICQLLISFLDNISESFIKSVALKISNHFDYSTDILIEWFVVKEIFVISLFTVKLWGLRSWQIVSWMTKWVTNKIPGW